jgi:hypothetical protein
MPLRPSNWFAHCSRPTLLVLHHAAPCHANGVGYSGAEGDNQAGVFIRTNELHIPSALLPASILLFYRQYYAGWMCWIVVDFLFGYDKFAGCR